MRPASAFVLIAVVVLLVGARAAKIAFVDDGAQPDTCVTTEEPLPQFDIIDSRGRPLALFVNRIDLVMSPRAMWRAHTPDHMAERIAATLRGRLAPEELLERMLPDAEQGVIHVDPQVLALDVWQAERVSAWLATVGLDSARPGPRPVWIEATERGDRYSLHWSPVELLSAATRERQDPPVGSPLAWTRKLLEGLATNVYGPMPERAGRERERWVAARDELWAAFMPRQYKIVAAGIPAEVGRELLEVLEAEGVGPVQMSFERGLDRRYPPRESEQSGLEGEPSADLVGILGQWGYADREREPTALVGLERMSQDLIEGRARELLERRPASYSFDAHRVPRHGTRRYFREISPSSETPRVRCSLDLRVQKQTHRLLLQVMQDHDPAIAMAICLDVDSGEVLAVDAIDAYQVAGFAPSWHLFTPGSTLKVLIMASALEAGVVSPDELFDTHDGHYQIPDSSRVIREAQGAPVGTITASQAVSKSCNAVMVQLGMRMQAEFLHERLTQLGYGRAPDVGLGSEQGGYLKALPWKPHNTHASVCFGHELSTTLWQHAAALATVVRGGEWLPLRLLVGVEQNDVLFSLPAEVPQRVFPEWVCAEVRAMMLEGARSGTGAKVACEDILMGTKTGTAEKVPSELCLHTELAHNRDHDRPGGHRACRGQLLGRKAHSRSCYTSSMCVFGSLPGGDREIMVLVVVDEPRSKKKYGSDVAGGAAVAILREALNLTRAGCEPDSLADRDFGLASSAEQNTSDYPWAEMPEIEGPWTEERWTEEHWADTERAGE